MPLTMDASRMHAMDLNPFRDITRRDFALAGSNGVVSSDDGLNANGEH